jgi:hypothetical protein
MAKGKTYRTKSVKKKSKNKSIRKSVKKKSRRKSRRKSRMKSRRKSRRKSRMKSRMKKSIPNESLIANITYLHDNERERKRRERAKNIRNRLRIKAIEGARKKRGGEVIIKDKAGVKYILKPDKQDARTGKVYDYNSYMDIVGLGGDPIPRGRLLRYPTTNKIGFVELK